MCCVALPCCLFDLACFFLPSFSSLHAQDNTTFTGSINGDVYVWKGSILSRVVSRAHSGPVFAMFTCLEDGLIVSAGKEMSGGRDVEGAGEVKLWSADMAQSRSVSLGMSGSVVVRSVCRSKVRYTLDSPPPVGKRLSGDFQTVQQTLFLPLGVGGVWNETRFIPAPSTNEN